MAFKWGDKQLRVTKGSYTPPFAEVSLEEIALLPGRTGTRDTILQQGYQGRNRVGLEATVYSYQEYQSLLQDYMNKTRKLFVGADGFIQIMIIETLSSAERKLYPKRYTFSIRLVEA